MKKPKAFSLMELLVALAITAFLAATSTVFIQNAIKRARNTASINNMRQIGQWTLLYAADNQGAIPAAWNPSDRESWYQLFARAGYLDVEADRKTLVCPLMNSQHGKSNTKQPTSYAMNNYIGMRPNKQAWEGISKLQSASRPGATALLFNSLYEPGNFKWKYSATPNPAFNLFLPADGEHINVVYLDGSAGLILPEDDRLKRLGPRGSTERIFWNGSPD